LFDLLHIGLIIDIYNHVLGIFIVLKCSGSE